MAGEKGQKPAGREKRSFFRIDDVISVVANPVPVGDEAGEEFRKSAICSRAFSLQDTGESVVEEQEGGSPEAPDNGQLFRMMRELKTKLDFIINHLVLEKEGLFSSEKKLVSISASGIRFSVDHEVNVHDIMELKLLLPTYPPVAVFAYGEVKRVRKMEDGKYEIAMEYLNMGDSVRNEIIQYTLSHQRETIRRTREEGARE
ncbi:MAG: PilZ domain-containing protein [Nitrospiraceae bacterium]|nr:MAG: PilZ domain-containing protein [Nitrospiraceae bacterium]